MHTIDKLDETSQGIKEDVIVANIMASLNPDPWELHKKMKSLEPVNHMRRRIKERIDKGM